MRADRREFLKGVGWTAAGLGPVGVACASDGHGGHEGGAPPGAKGVLVDLTACVGCRLCEYECKKAHGVEPGELKSYDDASVCQVHRRPTAGELTVVNAWEVGEGEAPSTGPATASSTAPARAIGHFVYAKVNCLHCNHPACVSACIVGALRKRPDGAVTYDAWKCIGCRYCMVACPFQIPAYDYHRVLDPEVRKCDLCHERTAAGEKPACVKGCPREALTFGDRADVLALAHERIERGRGRYVDHVYGEKEVGGTSWVYVSGVEFERVGLPKLGAAAPPALTEAIQHGVFKYWIAPVTWYSFLAGMYWYTGRRVRKHVHADVHGHEHEHAEQKASHGAGEKDGVIAHEHHAAHGPVRHRLLTPGVWVLLALVLIGAGFWVYRMAVGLAASTNLTNERAWGLWIAMDVGSGIALAGGGFVSAAIFHVFHRERYHMLARSALVTALLGYTFYVPGLLADLGKWWKLPITTMPFCWQGNSVLFEVGMCVMIYLNVQYAELTPIVCEGLLGAGWAARWPRLRNMVDAVRRTCERVMPALLCLGVCLSTFHQSSLGNLLVIAPYKLHPLWWSPVAPLLFLMSAMMVGLPMVIFTILFASRCLNREPEMAALTPLARKYVPVFVIPYLLVKVGDMVWRGTYVHLTDGSRDGMLWVAEMVLVIVPLVMFLSGKVCRSPKWLGGAALLLILGVVLNRLNVLVLGFHPPYEQRPYVPSVTEFMVSIGLVAALMLVYRVMVTYLPILEPRPKAVAV